ncbi:iron-containing alcohol dehydrogenase [Bradyrhizobium sp. CB2312]|uniref:iron-containing alcohol dehydrogenase n=1 Tax=Bradyrhizobium sp. CB2312 TaxID=3039155 RepID=UPI0024B14DC8|nr:iron-containing alcohol dehydrogenase [Bradyrhizobium sp. CB2312]WFU75063.1 iron-containing alcohol dehydrogenase [Bradyrhizobium sp. CB2312]
MLRYVNEFQLLSGDNRNRPRRSRSRPRRSRRSDGEMARATIEEISRLFAAIGITPTLAGLGLPSDRIDWTAELALGIDRLIKNNPRPSYLPAMKRLVKAAYDGDFAGSAI